MRCTQDGCQNARPRERILVHEALWHPCRVQLPIAHQPGVYASLQPPATFFQPFGLGSSARTPCPAGPLWPSPNPKGCQKVAGGRSAAKTSGKPKAKCVAPRMGDRMLAQERILVHEALWHPSRVRLPIAHQPGVFASLQPPATFFQPFGLRSSARAPCLAGGALALTQPEGLPKSSRGSQRSEDLR